MTNPHSPIVDFYPPTFEVDMEGKRAEWEAIVLIPFIHQRRLLAAEAGIPPGTLTEAERARNQPGPILIFSHAENPHQGAPPLTTAASTSFTGLPWSGRFLINHGCALCIAEVRNEGGLMLTQ